MEVAAAGGKRETLVKPSSQAVVAHVVPEYLPRSATFIHTMLAHQTRFRALVLAKTTSNLDEFPIEQALALGDEPSKRRSALKARLLGRDESVYGSRIATEARRAGCRLIHAHFGWSGRDAVSAARSLQVPLVTTFYGRDLSEPERARFRHPYTRLFAAGSAFVVEGPFMAERLAAIGCPRELIHVVPIGIDLERFPFAERADGRAFIAIQAARFVEKKGVDLTVRAFAAARKELGNGELWLVGDGPLRSELEHLAEELGVAREVHFAGLVSQDEYRALASRAHVALQPSRSASDGDQEGGAPTVILEFEALGIPVVATAHADIPFVVPRPEELLAEEDVEGLTDTLLRIATESAELRHERVREARSLVERQHDARRTASMVEDVYESVLA